MYAGPAAGLLRGSGIESEPPTFTRKSWLSVCSSGTFPTGPAKLTFAPTSRPSPNPPTSSCRSIVKPAVHAGLHSSRLATAPTPRQASSRSTRSLSRGATSPSARRAHGRIVRRGRLVRVMDRVREAVEVSAAHDRAAAGSEVLVQVAADSAVPVLVAVDSAVPVPAAQWARAGATAARTSD